MYRTSNDLRFVKNREAMQRAFIDLTLEKGYAHVTVADITRRARVNRMTFYSHYDSIDDLLYEFTDAITAEIQAFCDAQATFDVGAFFKRSSEMMYRELDFFKLVAVNDRYAFCRARFRNAFSEILRKELARSTALAGLDLQLTCDMLASSIAYAYLDWLAGQYGDVPIERVLAASEALLRETVERASAGCQRRCETEKACYLAEIPSCCDAHSPSRSRSPGR